ncbi:Dimethylmenaquinone methyltransferase [Arcobacter nitrofigilis DSM 7299]|uniref:Putative 4-hydroxy-4-methyl-2-oxoglutarate aldolase n=1 Tax=Arcobacter nitrofigilis (strain ATCC 33309 / DSM 7299 / CCUG 15893 / LMG 7604 / NCTC 12251 / CI) TaxID=572480 RepID=D5V545_ARCNC|nr:dimethylmenaquinone methyltransferase [Arcobacter nitrofigilis]ADG92007.1 Dimethylmenaquinone methyltransferase [Arcobacter nitrofigilis DSM 7299]
MNNDKLKKLENIATTLISDTRSRMTGIVGLKRIDSGFRTVGRAFTIKTRPSDNLAIYEALTKVKPGDFLIVESGNNCTNALVGELITLQLEKLGGVGIIVDGAIRDYDKLHASTTLACYARGISHKGPFKTGPGFLNVPISICGQIVNPGDIVVADDDGIVTFPEEELDAVLLAVQERIEIEEKVMDEINMTPHSMTWIQDILNVAKSTSK